MKITKSITFDAAHYLNAACVEEAGRPYARLHGHSFTLEATIEGEPTPAEGWIVDFADLASALEALREDLDHRLLNEVEGLSQPTLENICAWAAARLKPGFPGLRAVRVARASIGESCVLEL